MASSAASDLACSAAVQTASRLCVGPASDATCTCTCTCCACIHALATAALAATAFAAALTATALAAAALAAALAAVALAAATLTRGLDHLSDATAYWFISNSRAGVPIAGWLPPHPVRPVHPLTNNSLQELGELSLRSWGTSELRFVRRVPSKRVGDFVGTPLSTHTMARIRSVLATLLWASPASPVLLSGAARPLASCRVPAPVCLADRVEDANAEDPEVTKARALSRLQSQAVQWLAMSSAINLSEGEGLQPFAVPEGWMAAPSAPPAQAFTNDELIAEIERHEPALLALLEACAERAPSLCTPSAMLPLARLAAWTERDAWVRAPSGRARLQPHLAETATLCA